VHGRKYADLGHQCGGILIAKLRAQSRVEKRVAAAPLAGETDKIETSREEHITGG
jgi:hypothetical protein